jgi:polyhydroxyalkanoate synthesis repressor PhaR
LGDVKQLVLENVDIQVVDAKTQDDITRSVLLQIILEEENGGMPMFSYEVLTQFIRFYGQAMQGMMGPFLEKNLQLFGQMQQKLQEQTRACTATRRCSIPPCGGVHEAAGPAMQNVMSSYMEQSTGMFLEMQNRMQEQTKQLFSGFGFPAMYRRARTIPTSPDVSVFTTRVSAGFFVPAFLLLTGCGGPRDLTEEQLAELVQDVYVRVADHPLVLPRVAVESSYAGGQSFSSGDG